VIREGFEKLVVVVKAEQFEDLVDRFFLLNRRFSR
tara:strand:- start:4232 stop:4336 length:105 start_codon:yes stop_codon:yes gene_type:complete